MSPRYVLSAALADDLDGIVQLAQHLNTVNLPHDPESIELLLERSEASFAGTIADPTAREYVFVLRDVQSGHVVGTSMVVAKLGRRGIPYIYLDVDEVEKYSATLDLHFVHTVLTARYVYDGPTEIGGLVVHPAHRKGPDRLGTQISFVRFLFLAMHRREFQPTVLAELLPPLTPGGHSHLWEAFGRRFTGMDYQEADRLSKTNKEFIHSLFPVGPVHATLFSEQAQAVIGEVGPDTRGVERMLTRIGFRYAHRVDPFDGGPHYLAERDAIVPVAQAACLPLVEPGPRVAPVLVGRRYPGPPYFLACVAAASRDARGLGLPQEVRRWLDSHGEGPTWSTPL